ncbi:hypothetical protein [Cohnella sp.]|uniref:hypothetical protein n=1 Tax=Cohnella sp. TaxID=1883426 RepID=UPI0035677EA5
MTLSYEYNKEIINISETPNDVDVEFDIKILAENYWPGMKEIQKTFEEDDVYTDVLFYAYKNHHYRVIVRLDYYVDFILALMKHRLLENVKWN